MSVMSGETKSLNLYGAEPRPPRLPSSSALMADDDGVAARISGQNT